MGTVNTLKDLAKLGMDKANLQTVVQVSSVTAGTITPTCPANCDHLILVIPATGNVTIDLPSGFEESSGTLGSYGKKLTVIFYAQDNGAGAGYTLAYSASGYYVGAAPLSPVLNAMYVLVFQPITDVLNSTAKMLKISTTTTTFS